jgi:hypothetical protein
LGVLCPCYGLSKDASSSSKMTSMNFRWQSEFADGLFVCPLDACCRAALNLERIACSLIGRHMRAYGCML